MSTALWADLVARARGLRTHLVAPAILDALAALPDRTALADALARAGLGVTEARDPAALEAGIRRRAATELGRFARWLDGRAGLVAALVGAEDRRSVRALLRGTIAATPPATRLAGLLPTPFLPERPLAALARAGSLAEVAHGLNALAHPLAPPIARAAGAGAGEPDLFVLEQALDATWAGWATAGARTGGDRLRRFVAEQIDDRNRVTAGLLAARGSELPPERFFLAGGVELPRDLFVQLATTPVKAPPDEGSLLRIRRRALAREARLDPLGPAIVLGWLLDLRLEMDALRRIIWGLELRAPRTLRTAAPAEAR